jgi:hypothetical protein
MVHGYGAFLVNCCNFFILCFSIPDARKMKTLNNNNNNRKISLLHNTYLATAAAAATIFTLTIIFSSTTATLVSASTTTGNNTTTLVGGEQEGAVSSTTNTTTNNASNALLGSLFMIVEFETANVNPINETYIEISTVNNVTLIPPNATGTTTINATETANVTVNILPNGLAVSKGQSIIVTNGDDGGGRTEQENATSVPVDISRMNPDGTGAGTGVVFFTTNSTGQLAFLDNMVGISQSEFTPEGGTIRTWEWKGGTIPFENLIPQP